VNLPDATIFLQPGADVSYNDPYIPKSPRQREHDLQMASQDLTEPFLKSRDALIISTNHSDYDYAWVVKHSKLVIDARGATRDVTEGREKIVKA